MAIRVACPACGQRLRAPEALAGSAVACPGCGAEVGVPLSERRPKGEPAAAVRASTRPQDSGATVDLEHAVPATRLGVVALGLGLLSVAVLILPFIGYSSFVLSGLGLLFGLWGLFHALRRKVGGKLPAGGSSAAGIGGRGLSIALVGTLACLAALLLALLPFLLGAH
jgi:hypothetical protein